MLFFMPFIWSLIFLKQTCFSKISKKQDGRHISVQKCKYKGKCYKKWTYWHKTFSLTRHGMFFGSLIKEGYLGWYFDFWKNKKIQDGRHFFRKIKGKHYKEDFKNDSINWNMLILSKNRKNIPCRVYEKVLSQ